LLDAECQGLYWKPLDAAIVHLLAQYCLSGCQGNRQQQKNAPLFLANMMAVVVRQYNTAQIAQ
jgi:hypothetical protein